MTVIEQLHQLPLREKILAMEAIWDDLSRDEANLEVPQWHKDLLDERERAIAYTLSLHDALPIDRKSVV